MPGDDFEAVVDVDGFEGVEEGEVSEQVPCL